jgi:hypothetical protein
MAIDKSNVSVNVPNPVMRNKVADYLRVSETYELMGVGFETLDESPNAQSMQKTYVSQATATSIIKSYQTEFPYSADMIISENAVMALYECGRNHLTGTDAMFEYVRVDLFAPVESMENTFKARKFIVSNEVSGNTGNGGEPVTLAGNLKCVGDPVFGTFNTTTKTFNDETT